MEAGPKGPYQFVLIFNPYQVLYKIHKSDEKRIQSQYWLALVERAEEIGARDIEACKDAEKRDEKPARRRK